MAGKKNGSDTTVVELEDIEYNRPLVIGGFLGPTHTGFITANYIIDKMGLHQVAHVRSHHIPPVAVFIGAKLRTPFRIYSNDRGTIIVMVSEVPIEDEGLYDVASSIMSWVSGKNPSEILILEGAPVKDVVEEHPVFCAANEEKLKDFSGKGVQTAESILITGMGGAILNECLGMKVSGSSLITPTTVNFPDPGAALSLIEIINKVFDYNIDTEILEENVKAAHDQLDQLMSQYKNARKGKGPETMYG